MLLPRVLVIVGNMSLLGKNCEHMQTVKTSLAPLKKRGTDF